MDTELLNHIVAQGENLMQLPHFFFSPPIPFWQRDREYTRMLLRGNLPWLSVTEEPAQSVWRLWIVAEAQQTVRWYSGAYDHTEALPRRPHRRLTPFKHSPLRASLTLDAGDKTWAYCHNKSFLMSHLMPELYKSVFFSWNKNHKFFTACFFHHASWIEIMLPLDSVVFDCKSF